MQCCWSHASENVLKWSVGHQALPQLTFCSFFLIHVFFCFPSWCCFCSHRTFSFVTIKPFSRNCSGCRRRKIREDFTWKQKWHRVEKIVNFLPLSWIALVKALGVLQRKPEVEIASQSPRADRRPPDGKWSKISLFGSEKNTPSPPATTGNQVQVGRSRDRRALWGNGGWLICRWPLADVTTFILPAVTQITAYISTHSRLNSDIIALVGDSLFEPLK